MVQWKDNPDESIKIVIKFLSNEIRADGLNIDIRKKSCNDNKCIVKKIESDLNAEIKNKILKKAAIYHKKEQKEKKLKIDQKKSFQKAITNNFKSF